MAESKQEYARKQRRQGYHQANLQGGSQQQGESAELLRALSEIRDLPIGPDDDEVIGQFASEIVSTSNLETKEIRSHEWMKEVIILLHLSKKPTEDGLNGPWRGWVYGDIDKEIEPMGPEQRAKEESFLASSNIAMSRSEDAKVIEESGRTINESILNDGEESNSGGNGGWSRLP